MLPKQRTLQVNCFLYKYRLLYDLISLHAINLVTPVVRGALSDWSLARKQKRKQNKQTNKKRSEDLFLRLMFFCSCLLHLLQPFSPVAVYCHF